LRSRYADGEHPFVGRRRDVARVGDDEESALAIRLDERRADALRCAGDDGDFLVGGHDVDPCVWK
jgi:hypothetical protein